MSGVRVCGQADTLAAVDHDDLISLRALLRSEIGAGYGSYRRSLTPDYAKVWRDIVCGYAVLALTVALTATAHGLAAGLAAAALGAIAIGYCIAYLQLFIHEAAHGNLAADRKANDRIADWLIAWQVGTRIADYRRTHSEHHRCLGEDGDTETSYRTKLTPRFIAEMLFGVHAARIFLTRRSATKGGGRETGKPRAWRAPLTGAAIHLAFVASLLAIGAWPAALAWVIGVGSVYPFFATLRQLLEHRPASAEGAAGAVTRLFGDDILSRTFGGAGFNRHFLHHLEPQISYTRLAEFDAYLSHTVAGASLAARRTSYLRTFRTLLRDD